MGNAVPLCMCRDVATVAPAGRRRRPKNDDATEAAAPYAAAPRRASVMPLKQRDDAEQEETTTRARRVSRAGSAGDDTAAVKAPAATVKIVLRRKDAEALVARLNAQSARERKDRMAEIKGELRAGECGGGGGASPVSCRDAWMPRLEPINEN